MNKLQTEILLPLLRPGLSTQFLLVNLDSLLVNLNTASLFYWPSLTLTITSDSVPSLFTSVAIRSPHPSVSGRDTDMKSAENKNVTYGTHLPPGKYVSGSEVKRMVSRRQRPQPRSELCTMFATLL